MKERRRDPRVNEENKVILSLMPNGSSQGGKEVYYSLTKDVSLGGIRVMTDAPLAVDSRVRIELTLAKSRKRIRAVARVRWVKELFGEDVFDMGLEFVDIDAEAELALIDHVYGKKRPQP
jgi:c-di-GMP-binding flagellar brake protein YcgR